MNVNLYSSANNYNKTLARLQKNLRSGRFSAYSRRKKLQVWNRLCRYARQLGIRIKAPIAAACFAAGLSLATPATAQLAFTERTGGDNPLSVVSASYNASAAFVDMDGDGDMDFFTGDGNGLIRFYRNTTVTTVLSFADDPAGNPFDGVSFGYQSSPVFEDIDGDGDRDFFNPDFYGNVRFFRNSGPASAPVFSEESGGTNPFNGLDLGYQEIALSFVDIDGDGDKDAFSGDVLGIIRFFRNTGTASAPSFVQESGVTNPLNGVPATGRIAAAFADVDVDGDMDAFIGEENGAIQYYKNTGTALAPVFTLQTGADNPFDGVSSAGTGRARPAFIDIDNDGDFDAFVGVGTGAVRYFENTSSFTLPLHLLAFNGSRQAGYNQLQWQTADEVNTKSFEIERSSNGRNFIKIATVNAIGNSNNAYSINDNVVNTGKLFYRLKMVDIDEKFTYSHIIWIDSDKAGVSIYPNPVKDVININSGNAPIVKTLAHVYDAGGRLLQTVLINYNQQQINVKSLSPGVYTIKFADGTARRFMKE